MTSLTRLAVQLEELKRRVDDAGLPGLGNSSIENGTLHEYSGDTLVQVIGTQHDGTHTTTQVNGVPHPVPSAPTCVDGTEAFEVIFDGTWVDSLVALANFLRIDVHVGALDSFIPDSTTRVGSILSATGGSLSVTRPAGTYFVKLIAVNDSGIMSAASGATEVDAWPIPAGGGTDGFAPSSSPDPVVIGGYEVILARWPSITNVDPVRYQVHISDTSGFIPDASTLVAVTGATQLTIKALPGAGPVSPGDPDERKFQYGVPYYVKIIAEDDDGEAAPSAEAYDTIYLLDGSNLAAQTITAYHIGVGSITGDLFSASVVMSSAFWTALTGARVGFTPDGYFAYKADDSLMLKIPTDGSNALFDGEMVIRGARVLGGISLESAQNELTADAKLTLMQGISAPALPPQMEVVYDYFRPSTAGLTAAEKTNTQVGGFSMGGPFDLDPAQVTSLKWSTVANRFEITQIRANGSRTWFFDGNGEPTTDGSGAYFGDLAEWEVWSAWDVLTNPDPTLNGAYTLFRFIPGGSNSFWLSSPKGNNSYNRLNTAGTPVGGWNGTHMYIAEVVNGTHLTFKTYIPTVDGEPLPAPIAAWESNAAPFSTSRKLVACTYDSTGFDLSTSPGRYLVAERDVGTKARFVYTNGTNLGSIHPGGVAFGPTSWSSPNVDAESFESPTNNRRGMCWDGTNFWTYSADGFLYKHTGSSMQWDPATTSSILWGKQALVDTDVNGTGTHTTAAGVAGSITMSRRAKVRWRPAPITDNGGVDDPNGEEFFVARGASVPANSSFHLQASVTSAAPNPVDFSSIATATAIPPTSSTFPNTNPAEIGNDAGTLKIDATGRGEFSSLFVGLSEVVPAKPYYFAYLSSPPSAIASGVDTTITTWTNDASNNFGITYSAGVFTFTRAGVYRITGQLWWNATSGAAVGSRSMAAFLNGTTTLVAVSQLPGYGSGSNIPTINGLDDYVRFAAGDTLRFRMGHTQGSALGPVGTDRTRSLCRLMYIRP